MLLQFTTFAKSPDGAVFGISRGTTNDAAAVVCCGNSSAVSGLRVWSGVNAQRLDAAGHSLSCCNDRIPNKR